MITSQSQLWYSAFKEIYILFNFTSTIPTTTKLFLLCLKFKCPQKEYLFVFDICYVILGVRGGSFFSRALIQDHTVDL